METYTYFASLAETLTDIPPDSIISRTLYTTEHVKVIMFGFAPGQELSEHTSARTAVMHFLRGSARLSLGGEASTASPGTVVYMQPRLAHSVVAETETVMLLTMFGD